MTAHLSKSPNDASLVYVMVERCYFAAYELVICVLCMLWFVALFIVQHRV